MAEKTILGRIIQKHDIEANWNLATDFIPKQGEIIVYDIDENYTYERFKIGDGKTNVNDLPFTDVTPDWSVNDPNAAGYIENRTHWVDTVEAPLTFDGDSTGKEVFSVDTGEFVKMSDIPKTAEELIGSTIIIKQPPAAYNDYSGPVFEFVVNETNIFPIYDSDIGSMIAIGTIYSSGNNALFVVSAKGDVSETGLPLSEGVYFTNSTYQEALGYTHSLSCLTGPQEVAHKLDEKYIPDTIARTSDIPDIDVPTKISELENDAGYIGITNLNGENRLSLPEATTITSSMVLGLHGDTVSVSGGSGSAAINIDFEDTITVTGDMQVQEPINDNSVVNKKYVDDCFEDVAIPSNVSAFVNDAGYINTTIGLDGNPQLSLPEMTTISSSMFLGLHGDGVSITDSGNTSSIVLDGMGGAQLNGDFHVQTPTANESIANKKYVDDAIAGIDVDDTTITSIGDGSATVSAQMDEVAIEAMGVSARGDVVTVGSYGNFITMTHGEEEGFVVTGNMTVQTPTQDNSVANKKYVDDSVAGLVDSAPETLNTLKELSTALGNDENFATTVANRMGNIEKEIDNVEGKIPTKVSTLTNDSGYITADDVEVPTKVSELTNDSGYQTAANVNTLINNATISTSQLTNGDSVDKLYLDGKFHIGSASSNKTFRLPADAITIEYSNDGGSTWTNYGNTAAQKEMLFDESQGYTWYLGKKTDKTQTTNDMLRVTISNVTDRYIGVKQVYHYASYNGQGLVFDLEYSTLSAPTTFVKVISDGRLRGWYGHNMYNFNQRTIGASNATTSAIRLTYKMNEINNSYASSSIKDIRFFGDNVWTAPADSYIGNMLKLNTPYKFTDDNTIDFPGTVDVNALKVNGTDISETYATKAEVEALVAKIEELMASI